MSPKNGDIYKGKVYIRKYAFERDDNFQLIDKLFNNNYKNYEVEIWNLLKKRLEKRNDSFLANRLFNYILKKSQNT